MFNWQAAPGAPRVSTGGACALLAQMSVAEATGVGLRALCGTERGDARTALARQMAMYLCVLAFAMNCADIARAFGRDRTTVRHAVRRIEEAREHPDFDRALNGLETCLRRAGAANA